MRGGGAADGLPGERPGHMAPEDLAARRAGLATAVAAGTWRTDPPPQEIAIGAIRCLTFSPAGVARGVVVDLHGGAFRIGCPEQLGPFAQALAARCGIDVIAPAYRLAPEHPFPAGLRDVWAVVRALADTGPLIVMGDSAGGGLAAGVAALAARAALPLAGLALLSPWLDLTVTNASFAANAATDRLFSAESAMAAAQLYLQGHRADDPLASPLRGTAAGFPPTYINVGTGEVLADDARMMVDRLRDAGIAAHLHAVAGMEHVAVTRGPSLTGSAETFAAVAAFVDQVLA